MSVLLSLLLAAATPNVGVRDTQPLPPSGKPAPAGKVSSAYLPSVVATMQKEGYRAKLHIGNNKRPYIESGANGATFYVYPQNCEDDTAVCENLMFRSSYDKRDENPVRIDQINAFNRDRRWARAYLDDDGSPVIELDVLFTDRLVDEKMFGEALVIWSEVLAEFHKAIDY